MGTKNAKLKIRPSSIVHRQSQSGFTLIELMIVVSILGILAAIVLPEFQSYQQKAREAQAKANLKLLRDAIERYAAEHNGIPPGYQNGVTSVDPLGTSFIIQLQYYTSRDGKVNGSRTDIYRFGPYIKKIPQNTFNKLTNVAIVPDGEPFPDNPTPEFGWMYQGSNKTLRLAHTGTDSEGVRYYDY